MENKMKAYVCPKCYEDFYKGYNKVNPETDFIKNDKLMAEKEKHLPHTAEENYEIYIDSRTKHFFVYYICHCSVCNFHFKYKAEMPVNIDAKWFGKIL